LYLLNFYKTYILTSKFCIIECIQSANKSDYLLTVYSETMHNT